jgi:hypothetical protein
MLLGILLPITDMYLPTQYTEANLDLMIANVQDDDGFSLDDGEVVLYGKALFPRYFEAGERMEDDRKGTIPDFSYTRVEFYLIGSKSAWITLPLENEVDFFPHDSEVLIIAEQEPAQRDTGGVLISGGFYKASVIYILDEVEGKSQYHKLSCSGSACSLSEE